MAHLIDKDAVVAEIEKLKGQLLRGACSSQISMQTRCKEESYDEVLSFLDTLEVKEVDLDKELNKYFITNNLIAADIQFEPVTQMKKCAQYFFELGLKEQKGE